MPQIDKLVFLPQTLSLFALISFFFFFLLKNNLFLISGLKKVRFFIYSQNVFMNFWYYFCLLFKYPKNLPRESILVTRTFFKCYNISTFKFK